MPPHTLCRGVCPPSCPFALLPVRYPTMVFLIVFLEKARALRDVNALGSNHPYATINFAGQSFRTGTEEDGKNPGTQLAS